MAASVTTTYQINGSRKFVAVIQVSGDNTGDVSMADVVQVSALTGTPAEFKIESVDWVFTGFTGVLTWHGDTDTVAVALPQYDGSISFPQPLKNTAGTGKDGDLHFTSDGLGLNKWGTIVIKGRHK